MKDGDSEKSMEAEMSLSISSWESKIIDRLLLLVVLLLVLVVVVLVGVVTVLDLERVNQPESLWWRDLKKSCGASAVGEWFNKGMKLKIGCWSRVNFWTDKWMGGPELLGEKFPCLFVLFEQQNCKVAWMGFMWGSSWEWTFVWRRNFQYW